MLIWRGWGILILPIILLPGGLTFALFTALLQGTGRYVGLALTAGFLAAAAVNWVVGKRLNRSPGRELVDPSTGQRVLLRTSHDFFFVPMQWWSILLAACAVLTFVGTVFGSELAAKL